MALDIPGAARYRSQPTVPSVVPKPYEAPQLHPRVSTPAPYDVPTWEIDDMDTSGVDNAFQVYQPTEVPGVTNGLNLKSLDEWRQDAPIFAQAKREEQLAQQQQQAQSYKPSGYTQKGERTSLGVISDIARSYIGQNRYQYGGFDCSKFAQEVAGKAGINIPRDTASQLDYFRRSGMLTNIRNAQAGDMIYFGSSASPSGRHVGVYIGNGMMIDNAGSGRPIQARSIAGRRILGVGRTSALYRPRGDGGYVTPAAYGMKGSHRGTAPYGLQPAMWKALQEANAELVAAGLPPVQMTEGFRSDSEQAKLKKEQPATTAPVGKSAHSIGVAADVNGPAPSLDFLRAHAPRHGLIATDEPWHFQLNPSGAPTRRADR